MSQATPPSNTAASPASAGPQAEPAVKFAIAIAPDQRNPCSPRAFSDEVDAGSSQKMRPNQKASALNRFHRIEKHSRPAGRKDRRVRDRARMRRGRSKSLPRRAALLISAALAGVALASAVHEGALPWQDFAEQASPVIVDLLQHAGLGLDQIVVTGQRSTSDDAIFKALDLASARYLVGFDSEAARLRIEQLPWVATAEVRRVYPSQLSVKITERTPFAVWRHVGRDELIDKSGRVLQAIAKESIKHLPVVSGPMANEHAAELMVLLARYRPLADVFVGAERVNGRRWSISLANGGRIELPPDGAAVVLYGLEAGDSLSKLLSGPPLIIDARASGRIAVRPARTGNVRGSDAFADAGAASNGIGQRGRP